MTRNRYVTLDEVLAAKPCYDRKRIVTLAAGRKRVRLTTIARMKDVPAADRLWLILQLVAQRDLAPVVAFARRCADRADHGARTTDHAADAADHAAYYAAYCSVSCAAHAAGAADHAADGADNPVDQLNWWVTWLRGGPEEQA